MLAALLLTASVVISAAPGPAVEVPFEVEDERLYVPVQVGGLRRSMILDTGVFPTVLDTATAAALGLDGGPGQTLTGVGKGQTTIGSLGRLHLSVDGVALEVPNASVVPIDATLSPYTGRHAPGIVGSRFFLEHTVTLDFTTGRMRVTPPGSSVVARGAIVVPLTVEGGIPYTRAVVETASGERVSLRVLVDLGAKATLLVTEPFLKKSGLAARAGPAVRSLLGAGVGGRTRYDFIRLGKLEVGAAIVARAVAGFSVEGTLRSDGYDALLGLRFLRRFRVTLDYAKSRMLLEPGPAFTELETFDGSGLYVCARGEALERLEVDEVAPGSPAAEAGILPLDVVVSLDGAPVAKTTLAALRAALSREPGTPVALGLRRGALERQVKLTLAARL